jgi:hypothetical protein
MSVVSALNAAEAPGPRLCSNRYWAMIRLIRNDIAAERADALLTATTWTGAPPGAL